MLPVYAPARMRTSEPSPAYFCINMQHFPVFRKTITYYSTFRAYLHQFKAYICDILITVRACAKNRQKMLRIPACMCKICRFCCKNAMSGTKRQGAGKQLIPKIAQRCYASLFGAVPAKHSAQPLAISRIRVILDCSLTAVCVTVQMCTRFFHEYTSRCFTNHQEVF